MTRGQVGRSRLLPRKVGLLHVVDQVALLLQFLAD